MHTCPTCGAHHPDGGASGGNSQRHTTIVVPEWQFALMRTAFDGMAMQLGMHGLGELANQLGPYRDLFNADREHLRFFEGKAVAMAFTGLAWGHTGKVRIGPAKPPAGVLPGTRHDVYIDFVQSDGQTKSLRVADNATHDAAVWFDAYFTDAAGRITPI
jgi:hypothetical protein